MEKKQNMLLAIKKYIFRKSQLYCRFFPINVFTFHTSLSSSRVQRRPKRHLQCGFQGSRACYSFCPDSLPAGTGIQTRQPLVTMFLLLQLSGAVGSVSASLEAKLKSRHGADFQTAALLPVYSRGDGFVHIIWGNTCIKVHKLTNEPKSKHL